MRIVIDLQGAQTESRFRGIGRFSLSLATAMARNRGEHDIIIALSGLFPETLEPIKAAFEGLLPEQNIRVWSAIGPTRENNPPNKPRREISERIREAFFADLGADAILITSLFEGIGDDAIGSVGLLDGKTPTAVVLHDLIPLISPDIDFRTNSIHKNWYAAKLDSLRRCNLLLSNSESSRQEAIVTKVALPDDVVSISGACGASFRYLALTAEEKSAVRRAAGIARGFVMYTGGADERKNLDRCIEAFSNLPAVLLYEYQLVFVGKMPASHVDALQATAKGHGLKDDDLVFTGYVDDALLVDLYNSCDLFIFPSLHEGLGLPPLEAMACGAPVIGSNVTSLPEIIGTEEALFDPESVAAITAKMQEVLTDDEFRHRLIEHGLSHVKKFSWDRSALLAIQALQRFERRKVAVPSKLRVEESALFHKKRINILLLKLDHLGDLLLAMPAISKIRARYPYANLDAVVGSWNVAVAEEFNIFRKVYAFDFYRKASAATPAADALALETLLSSLGSYDISIDLRRQRDTRFVLVAIKSKCKVGYGTFDPELDRQLDIQLEALEDIQFETTRLNRTHITRQMLSLVDALPDDINDYVDLPGSGESRPTDSTKIAIFPSAGNDIKQWPWERFQQLIGGLLDDEGIDLVELYFGSEAEARRFRISEHPRLRRNVGLKFSVLTSSLADCTVCIANNSFGAHVASYAGCRVVGVYAGHETVAEWAPVFGKSYVIHRAAHCSPCHLPSRAACPNGMFCLDDISVGAVESLVMAAVDEVQGRGLPPDTAAVSRSSAEIVEHLIESVGARGIDQLDPADRVGVAQSIARNHRPPNARRQLLLDVSNLVQGDHRSGIQRVVRAVVGQLLTSPPERFLVEPVYATEDRLGYRYARGFKRRFIEVDSIAEEDSPVEVWSGDIFLGLDLHAQIVTAQAPTLQDWRNRGAKVFFVIYDLLPVFLPESFLPGAGAAHQRWLETISKFDGAIAISRATAAEMRSWLNVFGVPRERNFKLGWFHLGGDVRSSSPTWGLPSSANGVIDTLRRQPTFITVGTLEPRKGHHLVLKAFDKLWREGTKVNLVIVGKQGWLVDPLAEDLRAHKELNKRLFWMDQASDEYLERLYSAASALLVASEAEGFGLPLVEAAKHGIPIIARDLPVFREVAGGNAHYFADTQKPEVLAKALTHWLKLYSQGKHPASTGLVWLTWAQSVDQLLKTVVGEDWPESWTHNGVHRYWGGDPRLISRVGKRKGTSITSTGEEGQLIFGPYLKLAAGKYRLELLGEVLAGSGAEVLDVVYKKGRRQVFRHDFDTLPVGKWLYHHEFTLDSPVDDLEIRLDVGQYASIQVDSIQIAPETRAERDYSAKRDHRSFDDTPLLLS